MEHKEEVVLVIKEIQDLRRAGKNANQQSSAASIGKFTSILVLLIGLILILGANLVESKYVFLSPDEKYLLWIFFLILTVLAVSLMALDLIMSGLVTFIKAPTEHILASMGDNLAAYTAMYERLDTYSTQSVTQARDELVRRSSLGISITGILVGSMVKVGLIPAIVAILVTLAKISADSPNVVLYETFSLVLVALYFFCFRLNEVVIELEKYGDVLSTYLAGRECQG